MCSSFPTVVPHTLILMSNIWSKEQQKKCIQVATILFSNDPVIVWCPFCYSAPLCSFDRENFNTIIIHPPPRIWLLTIIGRGAGDGSWVSQGNVFVLSWSSTEYRLEKDKFASPFIGFHLPVPVVVMLEMVAWTFIQRFHFLLNRRMVIPRNLFGSRSSMTLGSRIFAFSVVPCCLSPVQGTLASFKIGCWRSIVYVEFWIRNKIYLFWWILCGWIREAGMLTLLGWK